MTGSNDDRGFSLIETTISLGILTGVLLGVAMVLTMTLQMIKSAPGDLTATNKAVEAIESIVSARDTRTLSWAQIRNVEGESGNDGGVFLDGPQPIRFPGSDGLVSTADDEDVETVTLPGNDQLLGTPDDETVSLDAFSREIEFHDLGPDLRSITVTVRYRVGAETRTYRIDTYVSNYS